MSEESTYFGPERAKYPHLERGDKSLQDLRGDVDAAFLRVEKAFSAVENTIDNPATLGADPGDWKRYVVGAAPAGGFATFDIGTIAIRKQTGVYTDADGSGWYNIVPVLGSVIIEKNAGTIQRCSALGPPIVWTETVGTTAATISILDAALYYAGGTTELALAELGVNIGGLTSSTFTFTTSGGTGYCTDNTAVYANLDAINEGIRDLKSTTAAEGASLIGLAATAFWATSTQVQAALVAIGAQLGGLTETTYAFTVSGGLGYCTDNTAAYANINAINNGIISMKTPAAVGEGANLIAIQNASAYFGAVADVEAALVAISVQLGGATSTTFNFTENNVCTDDTAVYANLEALDLMFGDLASTVAAEGAALVGVETASGYGAAPTAQSAFESLLEGYTPIPAQMLIVDQVGVPTPISAATTPVLALGGNTMLVTWAATLVDEAYFTLALDPRIDVDSDMYVDIMGTMNAANDTPMMNVTSSFNGGGGVADLTTAFTAAFGTHTATIAAADIPVGAVVMGVTLAPQATLLDALTITGIRVRYTKTYA